jgi:hypothetical protein
MLDVERSILIYAPPEAITDIMSDPWRLTEWYVGVEQVNPDDIFPEVGGEMQMLYEDDFETYEITFKSLEYIPEEGMLFELSRMINGKQRWSYTPEGEGVRVVVAFEQYDFAPGVLEDGIQQRVEDGFIARLEDSLENLQDLIEDQFYDDDDDDFFDDDDDDEYDL